MNHLPGSEHGRRRQASSFVRLVWVLVTLAALSGAGAIGLAQSDEAVPTGTGPTPAPPADKAQSTETAPPLPPIERPQPPTLTQPTFDFSKVKFIKEKGEILYGDVMDHTWGFDEAPLYFTLKVCRDLPKEFFVPGPPEREISFSQLTSMPNAWRGKPVTVSLLVGGVAKWEVPQPELVGVDHFWKVEAHREFRGNLAEVFTLLLVDDPGNPPRGTPIRVKGYFYKIRDYETEHEDPQQGGNVAYTYSCPVLIGRYLQRGAQTPTGTAGPGSAFGSLPMLSPGSCVITAVGIAIIVGIVFFFVRRALARQKELHPIKPKEELTPEELAKRVKFLEDQEKSKSGSPGSA